jgi:hypothetical protein
MKYDDARQFSKQFAFMQADLLNKSLTKSSTGLSVQKQQSQRNFYDSYSRSEDKP